MAATNDIFFAEEIDSTLDYIRREAAERSRLMPV